MVHQDTTESLALLRQGMQPRTEMRLKKQKERRSVKGKGLKNGIHYHEPSIITRLGSGKINA